MCSDFNVCLGPKLDEIGGNMQATKCAEISLLDDLDLNDVCRLRNQDKKKTIH